jgi:ribA/ribD-fused uncharacterized protein
MATKVELFYSKSKSKADLGKAIPADWRRQLSNFWPQEIEVNGRHYPNAEAAFQAAKAMESSKPELAKNFEVGGSIGPDPADAKKAGTKKAYKEAGATLKAADWDKKRNEAMMDILQARYDSDPMFRQILEATLKANILLLHYERSGAKSYWGGAVKDGEIVGENMLGRMLMQLRLRNSETGAAGEAAAPAQATAAPATAAPAQAQAAEPTVAPPQQDEKPNPATTPSPSLATMGRASESVGAVSMVRKVFTARSTLLNQLGDLGYLVKMWQNESPAEIDMRMQTGELNFWLEATKAMRDAHDYGNIHVRHHIEKALRQIHIDSLAEAFENEENFNRKTDCVLLISKDLPNDSVKSTLESVYARTGIYIIVRALQELQFNVLTHSLVPKHEKMNSEQVEQFKKEKMIRNHRKELPEISRFDPVARAILLRPGNVAKIERPSISAGYYNYYRVCK